MILSREDKVALVSARLEAAKQALKDARNLAESGSSRGAMNRAYYAMFHAVSALAISRSEMHKKHTHLIAFFQKEYAKQEIVDRKHGRALQKAFEDRSEADYQDYVTFTREQMDHRLTETEEFINAVEAVIQTN